MLGRRRRAEDPDTEPATHVKGRHGADTVTTVLDPMDLLSTPISDGDLTVALARRPKVRLPSLTMTLTIVAVLGLGFMAGALVGKHYGSTSSSSAAGFGAFTRFGAGGAASSGGTSSSASSATSGSSGSSGFPGRSGLFGGSGAATFGTIKLVDGNIVYVQTETGSIVQVTTSAATKVTASTSVPLKDLTPGETVIVEGTTKANGSVAATSINQSGLGGGGTGG
jgi:hypothetical protein